MKTALEFIFFPATAGLIIVLALIFADGNPWSRRETPMLDQLAAQEAERLDIDVYSDPDILEEWTSYQTALNSRVPFPGAAEDGDCVYCGLNTAVCLCAPDDHDDQAAWESRLDQMYSGADDASAISGVRR